MIINIDVKSWHNKSIRSRFESKFIKDEPNRCWIWQAGVRGKNKYGGFRVNRTSIKLAHNVSYEIYVKQIPTGLKVLHICDNPLCVNPHHLLLGTQQENIKDRDQKGHCRNRYSIKQLGTVSVQEGGK